MFKNRLFVNCYKLDSDFVLYILDKLGYKPKNPERSMLIDGGLIVEETGTFYTTVSSRMSISNDYINCGSNIELFLSLAAMRDDSDIYQQFVNDTDQSWVNLGIWSNKGDFTFCLISDYYMSQPKYTNTIPPAHKASVEEIKNYLLLNPDYRPYRDYYNSTCGKVIFDNLENAVRELFPKEEYTIFADEEMYEIFLKKYGGVNEDGSYTVFIDSKPAKVIKGNTSLLCGNRLILYKNGDRILYVDNDGYICQYHNDETYVALNKDVEREVKLR